MGTILVVPDILLIPETCALDKAAWKSPEKTEEANGSNSSDQRERERARESHEQQHKGI